MGARTTTGNVRRAAKGGTSPRCSCTSRKPTSSRRQVPTASSIVIADGFLGNREHQTVSVDDAAAAQVDADASGGRRRDTTTVARRVAKQCAPRSTPAIRIERVTWVSGQLSLQTLAATRLSECWIHTGDIASALGIELPPTDRLRHIARLAWRTLPYAFERADTAMNGPVALDLTGPNGEQWRFDPDAPALTTIRGSAAEFCEVAARRVDPDATDLVGDRPRRGGGAPPRAHLRPVAPHDCPRATAGCVAASKTAARVKHGFRRQAYAGYALERGASSPGGFTVLIAQAGHPRRAGQLHDHRRARDDARPLPPGKVLARRDHRDRSSTGANESASSYQVRASLGYQPTTRASRCSTWASASANAWWESMYSWRPRSVRSSAHDAPRQSASSASCRTAYSARPSTSPISRIQVSSDPIGGSGEAT